LSTVCFLLAALSLGYFGLICIYSGISTDFCGVWVVISLIFLLMGIFRRIEKKDRGGMPKRFPIFIYTTFVLLAFACIVIFSSIARYGNSRSADSCDYCIVIGDRIYEDGVSTTLKKRLDRAYDYVQDNPETILVLSGGIDVGDTFPEALAMFNYLEKKGIPEERMLIEPRSESTGENLLYSKTVIDNDLRTRMIPPPIVIGVLTSDFHMYRTLKLGKEIFPEGLSPIVASSDPVLYPHQCVRECCAIIRDHMTLK